MNRDSILEKYEIYLHEFIDNKENGLLLTIPDNHSSKSGAFELTSGKFQNKYVTLWGLFNNHLEFNTCIANLAYLAHRIRNEENWYHAIVTSTATAKYLMEHLHSFLETESGPVDVYYLPPFPFHTVNGTRLIDFSGKSILILTDVIATGALSNSLVSAVERLGGKPVGVLSIVKINDGSEKEALNFTAANGGVVPHYFLTKYSIPALKPDEVDLDNIIKINPVTIFPENSTKASKDFNPVFSFKEALGQFEDSESLVFNFHENEGRQFTTAFRLEMLFKKYGREIWERIKNEIPNKSILVTTYSRDDMLFHKLILDFCEDNHKNPYSVFIPKSDSIDPDFSNSFIYPSQIKLAKKQIVLILSSIYAADNLRKIISLLTLHGVAKITVICLFNRMGSRTFNFISRIKKLLGGIRRDNSNNSKKHATSATFKFIPIYKISDIKGVDLIKMQQVVQALMEDYMNNTPEPVFQALAQQELKYFKPLRVTTRRFQESRSYPLSANEKNTFEFEGETMSLKSKDGKQFALCSHAVITRDYKPLIQLIEDEKNKDKLYQLFGILLCDVSYLRISRQFKNLRNKIIESIQNQRYHRYQSELFYNEQLNSFENAEKKVKERLTDDLIKEIGESVELETFLLFGLSLFSYLDKDFDYKNFIIESLIAGFISEKGTHPTISLTSSDGENLDRWEPLPFNYLGYYNNEKIMWTISMLTHFTQDNSLFVSFHEKGSSELKKKLKTLINHLLEFNNSFEPQRKNQNGARAQIQQNIRDARVRTSKNKIKNNFNYLLKELGVHKQRRKHQVIRYLQYRLVETRQNHNPIFNDIKNAYDNLIDKLTDVKFDESSEVVLSLNKQILFNEVSLKRSIENAITAVATLEDVAKTIERFFYFHPLSSNTHLELYVSGIGQSILSMEILKLKNILQNIRSRNSFSQNELKNVSDLREKLVDKLINPESVLVKALRMYSVSLNKEFLDQIKRIDKYLASEGFSEIWSGKRAEIEKIVEHYVLIEPGLLREVLYNICTNVRHGLKGEELAFGVESKINIDIQERTIYSKVYEEELEYVVLTLENPAKEHINFENKTLNKQKLDIEQYGGSLEYEELPAGKIRFTLKLIARNKFQKSL